jgi:TonB family protein
MKLAWFHFVIIAVLAHAFAVAQPPTSGSSNTLAYEDGSIASGRYTNECFGFSLVVPDGWQFNTQLVGADGKAKHTTRQLVLLMLDQHKEGSFGNRIVLTSPDAKDTLPTAEEYVSNFVHGEVDVDREHRELVRDAYAVDYGGKHFFRADYKQSTNGRVLYLASVYTKFRGYYIGETVIADSPEGLEQSANSLQHISFREDEPNSKCVMRGDDSPNSTGTIGGVIGSVAQPPTSGQPSRVRVSQRVSVGLLIKKISPHYPEDARQARIQGTVVLQAVIDANGDVKEVALVSGHPLLAPAALEAVKHWKYKPYLLNGQPVEVETQIVVAFQLSGR